MGMAMSEAAKLFDSSGGNVQGNKQDAVTSAGQVIMKMMLKSQVSGVSTPVLNPPMAFFPATFRCTIRRLTR